MSLVRIKRRTMVAMQNVGGCHRVLSRLLDDCELAGYLFRLYRDPDWRLLYLVRCRPRRRR